MKKLFGRPLAAVMALVFALTTLAPAMAAQQTMATGPYYGGDAATQVNSAFQRGDQDFNDLYGQVAAAAAAASSASTSATAATAASTTNAAAIATNAASIQTAIGVVPQRVVDWRLVDFIGDSRAAQVFIDTAQASTGGNHWFNQLNAMLGAPFKINADDGISGARLDQYMTPASVTALRTDAAGLVVFNSPIINDLGDSAAATFTGSISGTVLTATTANSRAVRIGSVLTDSGAITAGTSVLAQLTGTGGATCASAPTLCTGGVGTYTVSQSQTVASETITATGYTSQADGTFAANGTYITTANLAAYDSALELAAMNSVVSGGKKVLMLAERGGGTVGSVALVNAKHEMNLRLKGGCEQVRGCYFVDTEGTWLNPLGSATQDVVRTGFSGDNTHSYIPSGWADALFLAPYFKPFVQQPDTLSTNINQVAGSDLWSLVSNPLFNTTTGGSVSTLTLSNGSIPSTFTLGGAATSSCTAATQADTDSPLYTNTGLSEGNSLTLNCTGTATDTLKLTWGPSASLWNLSDTFECGIVVKMAAGSSNGLMPYFVLNLNTYNAAGTNSTATAYANYAAGFGLAPTTAIPPLTLKNKPFTLPATAVTKGYMSAQLLFGGTGSWSETITVSRPTCERRF